MERAERGAPGSSETAVGHDGERSPEPREAPPARRERQVGAGFDQPELLVAVSGEQRDVDASEAVEGVGPRELPALARVIHWLELTRHHEGGTRHAPGALESGDAGAEPKHVVGVPHVRP